MSQVAAPHAALVSERLIGKHLPRPRLLAKLRESIHRRLTLLCAPAGAGKTTLLRDFAQTVHVRTVWCQLDRSDRDPAVLASRILQAVNAEAEPIKLKDGAPLQSWEIQSVLLRVAHALSAASGTSGGHLVLLLDDYHKIDTNDAVRELMSGLVELVARGVHLVISSRTTPALPLARLRLDGDLLELTQEDLVLDANEVSAFLTSWGALGLSEEEVKLVLDKTGGWIAGISMLTQSLKSRGKSEMIAFLREFSGSSSRIYDYFAEEVLQQQPPVLQQQLMSTSLLNELHRDIVNPLLGITTAQELLESLTANNVFIFCLDENHERYRYHPLFRDFLRARAQRKLSQQVLSGLHRRAAKVYAQRENWGQAIEHLCLARDFDDAAKIIERVGEEYLERGNLETVKQWLAVLPEQLRHERPRLLMIDGVVAQRQGRYQEAMRALTQAQTLFAEAGDTSSLSSVAAERAMVSYRLLSYREAVDLLECTLATVSDSIGRAATLGWLCINYKEMGDLKRSARFGEAALKALASSDSDPRPGLESRTLRMLAQTYTLQGDLDRALSALLRAADLCSRERFGDLELAWVKCSLGVVRAVRGEADLAMQAFAEAEAHGASYVEPQRQRLNLWKGNVLTDLGDFEGAEECYQIAGFPAAERAWLYVRQRQPGRAILIAREALDEVSENEPPVRANLVAVLGLAAAASGQEARALKLLGEAEAFYEAHGYVHHLASLRLHMAHLLTGTGEIERGVQMLRETVQASASHGLFHFYWWEPQVVSRLLPQAFPDEEERRYVDLVVQRHRGEGDRLALETLVARRSRSDGMVAGASLRRDDSPGALARVLASCGDPVARGRIERVAEADPLAAKCVVRLQSDFGLTWREIEVFVVYYLDRRFSSSEGRGPLRRDLATELCMTENTLKSHVKRIRRKLDLPDTANSLQVFSQVIDQGSAFVQA